MPSQAHPPRPLSSSRRPPVCRARPAARARPDRPRSPPAAADAHPEHTGPHLALPPPCRVRRPRPTVRRRPRRRRRRCPGPVHSAPPTAVRVPPVCGQGEGKGAGRVRAACRLRRCANSGRVWPRRRRRGRQGRQEKEEQLQAPHQGCAWCVRCVPRAILVLTGVYAIGKHSMKRDDYLMTTILAPPKTRTEIRPFDRRTQEEAFTVSLGGLPGVRDVLSAPIPSYLILTQWNSAVLIEETPLERKKRVRSAPAFAESPLTDCATERGPEARQGKRLGADTRLVTCHACFRSIVSRHAWTCCSTTTDVSERRRSSARSPGAVEGRHAAFHCVARGSSFATSGCAYAACASSPPTSGHRHAAGQEARPRRRAAVADGPDTCERTRPRRTATREWRFRAAWRTGCASADKEAEGLVPPRLSSHRSADMLIVWYRPRMRCLLPRYNSQRRRAFRLWTSHSALHRLSSDSRSSHHITRLSRITVLYIPFRNKLDNIISTVQVA
jgi:hypothetical protein